MRKLVKVISLAVAVAGCACAVALAGCSKTAKYSGDYHYATDYGTYGVKVSVEVEGDVIKSVKLVDSDYIVASDSYATWDRNTWSNGADELLAKYEGKTVSEVLAITVSTAESGQPESGQALGGLKVTGSTQSSGRLLLAVQDALKELAD